MLSYIHAHNRHPTSLKIIAIDMRKLKMFASVVIALGMFVILFGFSLRILQSYEQPLGLGAF